MGKKLGDKVTVTVTPEMSYTAEILAIEKSGVENKQI
jgi:transcription elongation GreA/GreB family factor